jgi:hypothetical protein
MLSNELKRLWETIKVFFWDEMLCCQVCCFWQETTCLTTQRQVPEDINLHEQCCENQLRPNSRIDSTRCQEWLRKTHQDSWSSGQLSTGTSHPQSMCAAYSTTALQPEDNAITWMNIISLTSLAYHVCQWRWSPICNIRHDEKWV